MIFQAEFQAEFATGGDADAQRLRRKVAGAEGAAVPLLAETIICMTGSRYV